MKIKCDVINDLLPLYVDNVLSDASRELVEEHIKECGSCRKTLENMKGKVSIPVNSELRIDESKSIKGLKKNVDKWKWLVAVVIVLAVIVIGVLSVLYMTSKTISIPYNGKNISLVLIGDEYYVVHNESGAICFSSTGDHSTGEYTIELSLTLWEKYIWPLYHPGENDAIPLCKKGEITKLSMEDGTVIWEADEQEKKEFEAYRDAEMERIMNREG